MIISIISFGQNRIIQNEKDQAKLELSNVHNGVNNYFTISKEYIEILLSSKDISSYFLNKALGMSLQYGLKANIVKIENELKKFINNRTLNDEKLFDDILILDGNKALNSSKIIAFLYEHKLTEYENATVLIEKKNDKLQFFIVESIYLSNKKVGTIIAKLNTKAMFDYKFFSFEKLNKFHLHFNNECFDIKGFKVSKKKDIDSIRKNILNGKLQLIMHLENSLFYTSNTFLYLFTFLSLFLFILVYYIYNLNTKNILLKVKIDSAKKLNEKLEVKVEEKTKELKKLNKDLYDKVKEEISKNKQKESIIYNQSKMAIMGQMLDNIAHQWRQPLSAISSTASSIIVQKELNILNDKDLKNSLNNVIDSTKFLSETIEDFRGFLRQNKKKNYFKLKDIYLKTRKLLISVSKKSDVVIIEELDDIDIYGYGNELVQVLINLFNNAYDAFANLDEDIENKFIFVQMYKKHNKINIIIKDNAKGIPEDIIDKVFDAHFTTKDESVGTGIGLYMTKELIINNMQGDINVENITYKYEDEFYTGAKFTITLPA